MISVTTIVRALAVSAILAVAASTPAEASVGVTESCHVCSDDTTCPAEWELGLFDSMCQTYCGYGTYAGACDAGGSCFLNGALPPVFCYYIE